METNEKGSFENPYTLAEYQAFPEGACPGGYVQLEENEDPEYVPSDMGGDRGEGCGSGEGSGSGSGGGSDGDDDKIKFQPLTCSLDNTNGHCHWSGNAFFIYKIEKTSLFNGDYSCTIKEPRMIFSLLGVIVNVQVEGQTDSIVVQAPPVVVNLPDNSGNNNNNNLINYSISVTGTGEYRGTFVDPSNNSSKNFKVTFNATATLNNSGMNTDVVTFNVTVQAQEDFS